MQEKALAKPECHLKFASTQQTAEADCGHSRSCL